MFTIIVRRQQHRKGPMTLDRRRHGAYRLVPDGKSYRKPRPLKKQPKVQLEIDPKKEK